MSRLYLVGIGPGGAQDMTLRARAALEESTVLVGYGVYLDLLRGQFPNKEYLSTPMTRETQRCQMALERARAGETVALVCSGDAGIYGMAGLTFELAKADEQPEIEVIPGVTAALGGAALLGAPLGHDFAVVSLSDRLTPWETIEKRLAATAQAGLILCLYNPASRQRAGYLQRACEVVLRYRGAKTVCGIARQIGREGEQARILTLGQLSQFEADMFTTVYIGNETTLRLGERMVTPRGYRPEEGQGRAQ